MATSEDNNKDKNSKKQNVYLSSNQKALPALRQKPWP